MSIALTKEVLAIFLTSHDMRRLEIYCSNQADYHMIMDRVSSIAYLYFLKMMGEFKFQSIEAVSFNVVHINT